MKTIDYDIVDSPRIAVDEFTGEGGGGGLEIGDGGIGVGRVGGGAGAARCSWVSDSMIRLHRLRRV